MTILPWLKGPFELIGEAEIHFRRGRDLDKRLALISFDNSVEVSIATYLTMNYAFRKDNHKIKPDAVAAAMQNFYSRISFFFEECARRRVASKIPKPIFIHCHDIRSDLYHGGRPSAPYEDDVLLSRQCAIQVFSILFDFTEADVETFLEDYLLSMEPPAPTPAIERDEAIDNILYEEFGYVDLADNYYSPGEILLAVDPEAYRELGLGLLERQRAELPINGDNVVEFPENQRSAS